ncbi:MAG: T9SS type A sorting domain-containing protein [bacterium]
MRFIRRLTLIFLLSQLAVSSAPGMEVLSSLTLGNRTGVAVRDTVAFTVGGTSLVNVSIARPRAPFVLGQLDLTGSPKAVAVEGNYAYCAVGANGFVVVNIANPRAPFRVHSTSVTGPCLDLAVDDTILVVATGTEVVIVGMRNPSAPQVLSRHAHTASSVALNWPARRVYAGGTNGVIELNVTDPVHPVRNSHFGAGQGIAPVSCSLPYVIAAQSASLLVLNPSPLSQAGTFGASAAIRAVCQAGGYQSLIGLANGAVLHIGETQMPPELVASVNVGAEVRRMDVGVVSPETLAVVATVMGITIVGYEPISAVDPYQQELQPGAFRISAYPNPFNSSVRLELQGAKTGWHTLEVFDLVGRKVFSRQIFVTGQPEFLFEPTTLGTGLYFARITGVSGSASARLLFLK